MKTLFIYVQDNNLRLMYEEACQKHNDSVENNPFSDSGFDLFLPQEHTLTSGISKLDYEVNAAMYEDSLPKAFFLYSRSSIYKTPLRMTNSVGIIDSGYRGNLCSAFDVLDEVNLKMGQRLVQVCAPNLEPFNVQLVSSLEELGHTVRGQGGFGSTGV
jgi:dUTP pyrophosphatase